MQHLVVDTSLFSASFQSALISALSSSLGDFDSHINGTLIHSDNFQALNLLQARYREQVKCIYIDPPYNTEDDRAKGKFIYKDGFPQSSWLGMINDRLLLGKKLLNKQGVISASIDDYENYHLRILLNSIFGLENYLYEVIWNLGTGTQAGHFTRSHEYIQFYTQNKKNLPNFKSTKGGYIEHGALKKISKDNPASKIIFPAGMRFAGNNAVFSGAIGGSEKQFITGEMIFENGKLKYDVEIEAGWAMKNQILSWLEGKETFDTKGQKVKEFYFNAQGILWYIKERGTEHPATVLNDIANTKTGSSELKNILGDLESAFSFPKSTKLIGYLSKLITDNADLILDYFAGSGTTAHAVINLNREDKGNRQYILVEQGEYFDTVLKPRVQKVIYSKAWKDGKPIAEDKAENLQGVPQIVKVLKLESYEDTLNNLELRRSGLFDHLPENAQQDYLLHYMLNIESRGSLLNVSHFEKPFDYGLNISTTSAGAYEWQKVDLVETFNYLIGAKVINVDDKRAEQGFVAIECRLPNQSADEKTLIFWRDCERVDYDGLQAQFDRLGINPADSEYSQVYVNGDHTLETVWDGEQSGSLKIISIEDVFLSLMFEGDA